MRKYKNFFMYILFLIIFFLLFSVLIQSFKILNISTLEVSIISLALSALSIVFIKKFITFRAIYNLVIDLYSNRNLIFSLAKNDFKTKFAGSYFGIIWAFVQPFATILIFWFVFEIGLKSGAVSEIPFALWLTCGLIPWFFYAEAWNTGTNSFIEYSYLVKKVSFKVNILPIVKILSAFFVHILFVLFLIVLFMFYGYYPNQYTIQLFYYSICMFCLVIGLSFVTSSIIVFFRDLGQVMQIVLQFGMWLTPIMWSIDTISDGNKWIFKLNPMYYIVQGYRDTMISDVWFFSNIKQTFYFWGIVLLMFFLGAIIYKRLKPHFADVL